MVAIKAESMKVKVRKNQNNFEIVYEMDSDALRERLDYVSKKIKNIEKVIDIYSKQLELLKSEEIQLKQMLNS